MRKTLLTHIERHWDILIFLISSLVVSGMLYAQNSDAIASLTSRMDKIEPKVEKLTEVRQDVAAIKQKVDDIWDIMNQHKGDR